MNLCECSFRALFLVELLERGDGVLEAHVALEVLVHVETPVAAALYGSLLGDVRDAVVESQTQHLLRGEVKLVLVLYRAEN